MSKTLIAVYGSLRRGLGNHGYLRGQKFVGEFRSYPIFTLYSLRAFPGLKFGGKDEITFEVWEVDEDSARAIDRLEGYVPGRDRNHYEKREIDTPFGRAFTYEYNHPIDKLDRVEGGDWTQFVVERQKQRDFAKA